MKPTVKEIFEDVKSINPKSLTISSLGDEIITESNRQVADSQIKRIMNFLPKNSLAYKILAETTKDFFSDKQMWVISYELEKNAEYCEQLGRYIAEFEKKSNAKKEASKLKLQANREASADILEPIKKLKKIGEFGKWLNNAKNPYRSQHFSKKYTAVAVNEFLATIN